MGVKRFSFLFVIMLVLGSLFSSLAFAEDTTNTAGTTGDPTQQVKDLVTSLPSDVSNIDPAKVAEQVSSVIPTFPAPGDSNQTVTPVVPQTPAVNGGEQPTIPGTGTTADDIKNFFENAALKINLTASPAEPTTEPVTIKVETLVNGHPYDKDLLIKWLPGDKTTADFASAGNIVQGSSFQVTEKGTFTVYVQIKACGCIENVAKIDIPKPEPAPTPTPAAPTTTTPAVTPTVTPAATVTVTPTNSLPNTATPMYNFLVMGAILILAGLSAVVLPKKLNGRKI